MNAAESGMAPDRRVAVMDGANGYVGSNLAWSFLADDVPVVALSRAGPAETTTRIAMAVIGDGQGLPGQAAPTVVDYSLDAPDLGLTADDLERVFGQPCDYWHLAANVNFRPVNRAAVIAVNVEGTRRTVEAFRRHAPPGSRYFLISTAYCCGVDTYQPVERWYEPAPPSRFRNFYELSKRDAELVVRDAIDEFGVEAACLRLGQVVGTSTTGETTSDYGMYNLIRSVWAVARRRPNERVRVEGHPDANLHLVPIDACVRWMRCVAETPLPATDPVVHVVDRSAVPARSVVDAISRHLPLDVSIVPAEELARRGSTLLERVVAARIAYTGTYLAQPFEFGRDHLDAAGPREPPVIDDEVLDRIIGAFTRALQLNEPGMAPSADAGQHAGI